MKTVIALVVFAVSSAFAATVTNPQDCLKITNGLDRKYCVDKYLEGYKAKMNAEKATWKKGLTAKDKAAKSKSMAQEIQMKKDYIALMQTEVEMETKYAEELNAAKVAAPAAPKKEEKKKKALFGIKL